MPMMVAAMDRESKHEAFEEGVSASWLRGIYASCAVVWTPCLVRGSRGWSSPMCFQETKQRTYRQLFDWLTRIDPQDRALPFMGRNDTCFGTCHAYVDRNEQFLSAFLEFV